MKKKISILLLLLMSISNSGFALNMHYCNGKLANVFLLFHSGDCCEETMPMNDDSCDDGFVMIIMESPIKGTAPISDLIPPLSISELQLSFLPAITKSLDSKVLASDFFTPPISNIKIYLRVESFLN